MSAYWIGEHRVTDQGKFAEYLRQVVPMIERHGGHYLTRVGSREVLEGTWKLNRVVIFPTWWQLRLGMGRPSTSRSSRCAERLRKMC